MSCGAAGTDLRDPRRIQGCGIPVTYIHRARTISSTHRSFLPEEDFFVGVRLSKNRLFRGSYGMCDAPLGHIQSAEPSTRKNYDEAILPSKAAADSGDEAAEIEIQYGTGVKKVKAAENTEVLMPEIPVVSHEIGQYCVFPNFHEIDKYTGVLKARNFEVFRDRLEEKGMLDQADDFFYNSGKLAVQCYKEELEAAARTKILPVIRFWIFRISPDREPPRGYPGRFYGQQGSCDHKGMGGLLLRCDPDGRI